MQAVFVVRHNDGASGVFAVYDNREAANAAVRHLGGNPDYPVVSLGSWIVVATVQDTFSVDGPRPPAGNSEAA